MNMTDSTLMVRVAARRDEADGIVGFEFVDADGRDLPPFEAQSRELAADLATGSGDR